MFIKKRSVILLLSVLLFAIHPAFSMRESEDFPKYRMTTGTIETSAGMLFYRRTHGKGRPIVCVHGNSTSGRVFEKQWEELGEDYQIIAFDLPSHGASANARDPKETCSIPGYAKIIKEGIEKLAFPQKPVLLGWSLGGHIAIECLSQYSDLFLGILIVAAPPIPFTPEGMKIGFKPMETIKRIAQETQLTQGEARELCVLSGIDPAKASYMVEDMMRTEGRARTLMIQSILDGKGGDQQKTVETSPLPLAIVLGGLDRGINNDHIIRGVKYNENLFRILSLPCGHACHWLMSKEFNAFLKEFMEFLERKKF